MPREHIVVMRHQIANTTTAEMAFGRLNYYLSEGNRLTELVFRISSNRRRGRLLFQRALGPGAYWRFTQGFTMHVKEHTLIFSVRSQTQRLFIGGPVVY